MENKEQLKELALKIAKDFETLSSCFTDIKIKRYCDRGAYAFSFVASEIEAGVEGWEEWKIKELVRGWAQRLEKMISEL